MKIFLTGATGTIGKVILKKLIAGGHSVTCAVRNREKGEALMEEFGPQCLYVVVDLSVDPEQLTQHAYGHDGIIHAGFVSTEDYEAIEHRTVDSLLAAGSQTSLEKPCMVLVSSGSMCVGDHELPITETTVPHGFPRMDAFRLDVEQKVIRAQTERLTTAIIRPGWVYGASSVDKYLHRCREHGKVFVPRRNNAVLFIHVEDVAEAYVQLVLRKGTGIFHAFEPSIQAWDMAALVQQASEIPEVEYYKRYSEVRRLCGFFAYGMLFSQPAETTRLIEEYGLVPQYNFSDYVRSFYSR